MLVLIVAVSCPGVDAIFSTVAKIVIRHPTSRMSVAPKMVSVVPGGICMDKNRKLSSIEKRLELIFMYDGVLASIRENLGYTNRQWCLTNKNRWSLRADYIEHCTHACTYAYTA